MKKKKRVIMASVAIVLLILLFPVKSTLKDGGTVEYKALLYKVIKYHQLDENSPGGYKTGLEVDILNFTIFKKIESEEKLKEEEKQPNEETLVDKEKFMMSYTLDDGRLLSLSFEVPYIDKKNKEQFLGEAIFKNLLTIDDVTSELSFVDALNDGGSRLYKYDHSKKKYGEKDFYMIVCNGVNKINSVFIAQNKESLDGVCTFNVDDIKEVTMNIKEGTLSNKGVTLAIRDESDRENVYGEDYRLQILKDGNWKNLPTKTNLDFTSIEYTINKGKVREFEVDWSHTYGPLENGKYRILKSFGEPGEGVNHYLSLEFTILQ